MPNLKLLTINLGLLDFDICGYVVYSNPPYSMMREHMMPEAILKIDADIIAMQEVYSDKHLTYLVNALKHVYPHVARKDNKSGIINLHNGLLTLSKHEILDVDIFQHTKVVCLEDWFGDKCTLIANIWVQNIGRVSILNTHLPSGGTDPDSEKADSGRDHAIKLNLNYAAECKSQGSIPVLIGDFNCGPATSELNFNLHMNAGYRDTYVEALNTGVLAPGCLNHTWDSFNLLNCTGPHAHMPIDRLDHIFLPANDPKVGRILNYDIVFYEKCVEVPYNNTVTEETTTFVSMSDHYGIVIEFECL